MAALQRVREQQEAAAVLSVGAPFNVNGLGSLSLPVAHAVLDQLEEAWQACSAKSTVTSTARQDALRHYHYIHARCAACVPLSAARWQQWMAPLASFVNEGIPGLPPDAGKRGTHYMAEKHLTDFMQLFHRYRWGHASALKAGLDAALADAETALEECASNTALTSADTISVAQLEAALATPLQAFARLAAESTHLFGSYALVGQCERAWLAETVAAALGQPAEAAVEALVRRSFKRDLQVPSSALPQLLEEYEASEVEERKAKAILSLGQATLHSSWMRAAAALHAYEVEHQSSAPSHAVVQDEEGHTTTHPSWSSGFGTDARHRELEEALTTELKKLPNAQGCLAALGLLTGRLIDEVDRASTSTLPPPSWVGLSESQTHFYLYLLHQWFAAYVSSHHRWSSASMFCSAEDVDLWSFVLERHTVCLIWALATAQSRGAVADDADVKWRPAFLAALRTNTDQVRAVFYSVVHCLQVYRHSMKAFTKDEKRDARLRTATALAADWVRRVGGETFCRLLVEEVSSAAASCPCRAGDGVDYIVVDQQSLLIEVEVNLVLYDTLQMLDCAESYATERLESSEQMLEEFCDIWRECDAAFIDFEGPSLGQLLLSSARAAERCLRRIITNIRQDLSRSPTSYERYGDFYAKLVDRIRYWITVTVERGGDAGALWDMWAELTCAPVHHKLNPWRSTFSPDESEGETEQRYLEGKTIPKFIGYATQPFNGGRGTQPGRFEGDLVELCFERRAAAKKAQQVHLAVASSDSDEEADTDVQSLASDEDASSERSGDSAGEASPKRPRYEQSADAKAEE